MKSLKESSINSFADILIYLSPQKYKNLISKKNFNKITHIYNLFTPRISHVFGFETKLGNEKAEVDTAFCISPENIKQLDLLNDFLLKKPNNFSDPHWKSIVKLLQRWVNKEKELNKYLNNIWFEFDLDKVKSSIVLPGVYIGIKESVYKNNDSIPAIRNFIYTLNALFDYTSQIKESESLNSCINNLPSSAFINYIGFMPARSKNVIRLSVLIRNPADIQRYLNDIGIEKIVKDVFLSSIQKYIAFCDYGILHLDIGNRINPCVGLELRYFTRELRLFSQYRWEPVLNMLYSNGLCTLKKKKDIMGWAGMQKGSLLIDEFYYTVFRLLYYIKLIYKPDRLKAKAYFGYIFQPEKP